LKQQALVFRTHPCIWEGFDSIVKSQSVASSLGLPLLDSNVKSQKGK